MATKVIVLGKVEEVGLGIVFLGIFKPKNDDTSPIYAGDNKSNLLPEDFDFVELVCRNYDCSGYDLMFAYDKNSRDDGSLILGYFNSGVVVEA